METNQDTSVKVVPALDEVLERVRTLKQYELLKELQRFAWEHANSHRGGGCRGMLDALGRSIATACRYADTALASQLAAELWNVCMVLHAGSDYQAKTEIGRFWSEFKGKYAIDVSDMAIIGATAMGAYAQSWAYTRYPGEYAEMFGKFLEAAKLQEPADVERALRNATDIPYLPAERLLKAIEMVSMGNVQPAPLAMVIAKTLVNALARGHARAVARLITDGDLAEFKRSLLVSTD